MFRNLNLNVGLPFWDYWFRGVQGWTDLRTYGAGFRFNGYGLRIMG